MKYVILSVRDRKADCFGAPHFAVKLGAGIRGFGDEINRSAENNSFYQHPDDFDLYELGTFDDEDARFDLFERPKQVAIGADLKVR